MGIWGEGSIPQTSLQNLVFTDIRRELGVRASSGPRGPPSRDAGNLVVGFGVGLWAPGASRRQLRRLSRCARPGQKAPGSGRRMALHGAPPREEPRAAGNLPARPRPRPGASSRSRSPRAAAVPTAASVSAPEGRPVGGLYLLVRNKEPKSKSPASSYGLETKWNLKAPDYREKAKSEPETAAGFCRHRHSAKRGTQRGVL